MTESFIQIVSQANYSTHFHYTARITTNKKLLRLAKETKIPYEPIPHFYPHALRHTYATRCFEAGIDAKVVQGYLGHFSISITFDLYTHVTNDKAKTEMNKLEDLYEAII